MKRFVPRLCLPAALFAASIALPWSAEAAPEVFSPVLAIVNNPDEPAEDPDFIAVAITGSGFGAQVYQSKLKVRDTVGSFNPTNSYAATGDKIVFWSDTRIVAKLPKALAHPQVWVRVDDIESNQVTAQRYEYRYYSTHGGTMSGLPLAITNDGKNAYVHEEFGRNLKKVDLQSGVMTIPFGGTPTCASGDHCFANAFYDKDVVGGLGDPNANGIPDENMENSAAGEAVLVDDEGRIWFTQGGAGHYGGLAPNHSRIISFDPNATTAEEAFVVYKVPGDNNQVWGLAWDGERMWYASYKRGLGGVCNPPYIYRTRLVSFDPDDFDCDPDSPTISPLCDQDVTFDSLAATCNGGSLSWDATNKWTTGTAGTCSNNSSRACYSAHDCVLADRVCTGAGCFEEHELDESTAMVVPPCNWYFDGGNSTIGNITASRDGAIWYAPYVGLAPYSRPFVGRFDPVTLEDRQYPLHYFGFDNPVFPDAPYFYGGPWEIEETANGDIALTVDNSNALARIRQSRVHDTACLSLTSPTTHCEWAPDATCKNPCVEMVEPVGFDDTDYPQQTHSFAEDASGNLWFTQYSFLDNIQYSPSVGFWTADRRGIAMFPTFSIYADSPQLCSNGYGGFSGAGITINKLNGDVWFTDFCRRRVGRISRAVEVCE